MTRTHEFDLPLPEHQSIFADTIHGVPNPQIPHTHPYPTRFHGPVYNVPKFGLPYKRQTMVAPQGLPSPFRTGCPGGQCGSSGFGGTPALFGSATGSNAIDALIGAGIAWVVSGHSKDRNLWVGAGAAAGALAGTAGLLGILGVAFYTRRGRVS